MSTELSHNPPQQESSSNTGAPPLEGERTRDAASEISSHDKQSHLSPITETSAGNDQHKLDLSNSCSQPQNVVQDVVPDDNHPNTQANAAPSTGTSQSTASGQADRLSSTGALASEQTKKTGWFKIGMGELIALVLTLISCLAAIIVIPEVRRTLDLDPTPVPTRVISGRILNGDTPLGEVKVRLLDVAGELKTAKTNANGEFAFTEIIPGDYYIDFSNEAGVVVIKTSLPDNHSSVYVPIQVQDLIRVSFVYSNSTSFMLFINGRRVLLTDRGNIVTTDDDDFVILDGDILTNVYFLVPGVHSIEYYSVERESTNPESIAQNPYNETSETTPFPIETDYTIGTLIDSQTRQFLANEDFYIKNAVIDSLRLSSNQNIFIDDIPPETIDFDISLDVFGYKSAALTASIHFRALSEISSSIADFSHEKNIPIDSNNDRFTASIKVARYEFPNLEQSYKVWTTIKSPEGVVITQTTPQMLYFFRYRGHLFPNLALINVNKMAQSNELLFWDFQDATFAETFDVRQEDTFYLLGSDGTWSADIISTTYVISNTSDSNAVKYGYVQGWQGTDINLSKLPISVLVKGDFEEPLSSIGLMYRLNTEEQTYNAFVLRKDGLIMVFARTKDRFQNIFLKKVTHFSSEDFNRLSIIDRNGESYLYVNNLLIGSVQDDSTLGTAVGIISIGKGTFYLDNFIIFEE